MTKRFGVFLTSFAIVFILGSSIPQCSCFGAKGCCGGFCCSMGVAESESEDNCCQGGCCDGLHDTPSQSQKKANQCGPLCPCLKARPDLSQVSTSLSKELSVQVGMLPGLEVFREVQGSRPSTLINTFPTLSLARLCRWLK